MKSAGDDKSGEGDPSPQVTGRTIEGEVKDKVKT
jgi:hypothetical protein